MITVTVTAVREANLTTVILFDDEAGMADYLSRLYGISPPERIRVAKEQYALMIPNEGGGYHLAVKDEPFFDQRGAMEYDVIPWDDQRTET